MVGPETISKKATVPDGSTGRFRRQLQHCHSLYAALSFFVSLDYGSCLYRVVVCTPATRCTGDLFITASFKPWMASLASAPDGLRRCCPYHLIWVLCEKGTFKQ